MPSDEKQDILIFRTRLKPNKTQEKALWTSCAGYRWVYNYMLTIQKERYEKWREAKEAWDKENPDGGKFETPDDLKPHSPYELKKLLPALKTDEPTEWLKEIDSAVLQESVLNFGKTWTRFLQRSKTGSGFPKFRNRDKHNYIARSNTKVKGAFPQTVKGRHIRIAKIGMIKMYEEPVCKNRPDAHLIDLTRPSGYIISRKANHWWISIRYQVPHIEPQKREGDHVGIDMGIAKWATLSDGKYIGRDSRIEAKLKRLLERKVFYHRQLSRRPKQKDTEDERKTYSGSNREKTKKKLAKVWNRIAEIRRNYSHHASKKLSQEFARIAIEDLNIKNMTKSAKGTKENPGKNVKQKTGLNRSINQQNWFQFRSMLEYKMARSGGELVPVNPKNTSLTCSKCGHLDKDNRVDQAKFRCQKCGFEENADLNAAINICKVAFGG